MKDISIRMIRSNGFHPFKGSRGWKVILPVLFVAILIILKSDRPKKKPAKTVPKESSSAHQSVDARREESRVNSVEEKANEPPSVDERVRQLHSEGISYPAIARELNVSVQVVINAIRTQY